MSLRVYPREWVIPTKRETAIEIVVVSNQVSRAAATLRAVDDEGAFEKNKREYVHLDGHNC